MNRWMTCLAAVVLSLSAAAAPAAAGIDGRWATDDGKAIVTIARCGALLCGTISEILDRAPNVPKTDVNNPDPGLRSRPILGLPVLGGFHPDGNRFAGGTAYDPKTGKSYRAFLEQGGDGTLRVTGCIFVICRTKRWARVH